MHKNKIVQVLSAPICSLVVASEKDKKLFADKKDGWFYHFKLASGQSFVAHLDKEKQNYTFRPKNNLLSDLLEIQWQKAPEYWSMNYTTICQTKSESDRGIYQEILAPKPIEAPYYTKVAIQHYAYHPLLDKARWLQQARIECEKAKLTLLISQEAHEALLVSEQKTDLTKNLIQQKLKERRKNG